MQPLRPQRFRLTPRNVIEAYRHGLFPMAEDRNDPRLYWIEPELRGVIPLKGFHVPRRLARTVRQCAFTITIDRDFRAVIEACARPAPGRWTTWINDEIIDLYSKLHAAGHAHSVECWDSGRLIGGLYGVSIDAAFFGESMFSTATDASKVALVHLVARLRVGGYQLLDAQFVTKHLARFGTLEVPRAEYKFLLARALAAKADFYGFPVQGTPLEVLQAITRKS